AAPGVGGGGRGGPAVPGGLLGIGRGPVVDAALLRARRADSLLVPAVRRTVRVEGLLRVVGLPALGGAPPGPAPGLRRRALALVCVAVSAADGRGLRGGPPVREVPAPRDLRGDPPFHGPAYSAPAADPPPA